VVRSGQVLCSIGTSGTLLAAMETPRVDPAGRLHTFCHAVPDTWYAMGVVLSAGGSLSWWHDVLQDGNEVESDAFDLMLEGAAGVSPGSDGLIFLPYLSGERTPHADPDARGAFFGLSLRHGRHHLTRSVIEGVSFALTDSARLMRDLGVNLDVVRATGGGARSALWRQVLASLFDARVLTALTDAGPAFGASILAGVGTGCWASVDDAANSLVQISAETMPDPDLAATYAGYYRLFDGLYPALRGAYRELAALSR
jgi:xylulokinase